MYTESNALEFSSNTQSDTEMSNAYNADKSNDIHVLLLPVSMLLIASLEV